MSGKLRQSQPTRAHGFRIGSGLSAVVVDTHAFHLSLSAANLIAMGTTAISVIGAPSQYNGAYGLSADVRMLIRQIMLKFTPGSIAFTGGGAINLQYHTTTSSVPHAGTIPASLITATASGPAVAYVLGPNVGANGLIVPTEGIDITNAGGAFAAGNGTAELVVLYSTIKI